MKSKFYGKTVTNIWNNVVRYGIVRESKEENGWLYVRCTWIEDNKYEMDDKRVSKLRGVEPASPWFRIDKISFINVNDEISKLAKLSYAAHQVAGSADFDYYLTDKSNIRYAEWT